MNISPHLNMRITQPVNNYALNVFAVRLQNEQIGDDNNLQQLQHRLPCMPQLQRQNLDTINTKQLFTPIYNEQIIQRKSM